MSEIETVRCRKTEKDVNEEKREKYAKKIRSKMNFELQPPLTIHVGN